MLFNLVVEEIECVKHTTSEPIFSPFGIFGEAKDEVYFVVAGSTKKDRIELPRVSPPSDSDYYSLGDLDRLTRIDLLKKISVPGRGDPKPIFVGENDEAWINVIIQEQDNNQREFIFGLVKILTSPVQKILKDVTGLFDDASKKSDKLKDLAIDFVKDSRTTSGDEIIGAFAVQIINKGNNDIKVKWYTIDKTSIYTEEDNSVRFKATGAGSIYNLKVSVTKSPLVEIINKNSGKVLDVEGESIDDKANVQQYKRKSQTGEHGNLLNQKWYVQSLGKTIIGFNESHIWSANSGKVLDVEGASMLDKANVQQYRYHGGKNQIWLTLSREDNHVSFLNLKSMKALEVIDASMLDKANVQQYRFNLKNHQVWKIEKT